MSDLLTACVAGVRTIQARMTRPNEDWTPVMLFTGADGVDNVAYFDVSSLPDERAQTAQGLSMVLRGQAATEAVLLNTVWISTYEQDEVDLRNMVRKPGVERPSDRIDRFEAVSLTHATRDTITAHIMRITRTDDAPPTLGELEFEASGLDVGGIWSDALRMGIQ